MQQTGIGEQLVFRSGQVIRCGVRRVILFFRAGGKYMDIHMTVSWITHLQSIMMTSGSKNQKIVAVQLIDHAIFPDFPGSI